MGPLQSWLGEVSAFGTNTWSWSSSRQQTRRLFTLLNKSWWNPKQGRIFVTDPLSSCSLSTALIGLQYYYILPWHSQDRERVDLCFQAAFILASVWIRTRKEICLSSPPKLSGVIKGTSQSARGSHIDVTCRSVCDRDQKWNQAINVLFRGRSRDQDEFWVTNINWSMHFLR